MKTTSVYTHGEWQIEQEHRQQAKGAIRLVNPYNVNPANIEAGDVMLFVVKALVVRPGVYRLYRCPYPPRFAGGDSEIPQGSRIGNEREVCEALFPSLAMVAEPDGT